MSEMVEKVAAAICESLFGPYDATALGAGTSPSAQSAKAARAAIEAMREPTESMKEAGDAIILGDVEDKVIGSFTAEKTWVAMIDLALSE